MSNRFNGLYLVGTSKPTPESTQQTEPVSIPTAQKMNELTLKKFQDSFRFSLYKNITKGHVDITLDYPSMCYTWLKSHCVLHGYTIIKYQEYYRVIWAINSKL